MPAPRQAAMKTIFEYLIVSVIAILMAWAEMRLAGKYEGRGSWEFQGFGWIVGASLLSALTWSLLYHLCRPRHWLLLPVMGLVSPFLSIALLPLGCVALMCMQELDLIMFAIAYPLLPLLALAHFALVIFPLAIATGFLVSVATLPLRPQQKFAS
jgi:hypothetical protein